MHQSNYNVHIFLLFLKYCTRITYYLFIYNFKPKSAMSSIMEINLQQAVERNIFQVHKR